MAVEARGELAHNDERYWLTRAVFVLVSPREGLWALRGNSGGAGRAAGGGAGAVLALVLLAGVAGVLWTPTVGRLLEDKLVAWDGLLIAVVVFFGGGIYATFAYWTLGLVLHAAASPFRGTRSYRQAGHRLARRTEEHTAE